MASTRRTELVAIRLPPPEAATAVWESWSRDEAVAVLDPALPSAIGSAQLARLKPTAIVDTGGRRPLDGGRAVAASIAAVVLTSGTTAAPQAVALSRNGMEAMAHGYSTAIGASAGDRWLACVPLSGVAGLAILARSFVTGVPATIHAGFDPVRVATAPEDEGATLVSLVPTMVRRLIEAKGRLDGYRTILVGGSALPDRLRRRAENGGAHLVATYGMTETWGGFALEGRLIGGAEVRIARGGEIEVRGPMVMAGYLDDPDATADAMTSDGWFRTGDTGSWDGATLVPTGRMRDVIITGGVTVNPLQVEAAIREHPSVQDVAVAGRPDEEWGEAVVAFVVPSDAAQPPTLAEMRTAVKSRLASPAAPRHLVLLETIPRNAAGKVLRDRLG